MQKSKEGGGVLREKLLDTIGNETDASLIPINRCRANNPSRIN